MLTMEDGNATSATPATINIQPALVSIIMNVWRILIKLRWSIFKNVLRTLFKSIRFCATKSFVQRDAYQQLKIVLATGLDRRTRQESFGATVNRLLRTEGYAFATRGMQRNLVAVAAPIGMTIFLTEALTEALRSRQ